MSKHPARIRRWSFPTATFEYLFVCRKVASVRMRRIRQFHRKNSLMSRRLWRIRNIIVEWKGKSLLVCKILSQPSSSVAYKDVKTFWLYTGFIKHTAYNTWLQFTVWRSGQLSVYIALSLFHNYTLQFPTHALSHLGLLSVQQPSGTGFQQQAFPFLGSRTVPVPQPQRLTVHSPSPGTASPCSDLYCLELSQ
jgi:hypothetical protein